MQLDDYKEGIKLYNPQQTSAKMLKDNFVIRLYEYKKLWRAIEKADMQNPEQHYIIQGLRGAGKTTLLSRLALAVTEDQALSKWLIPVVFKEEEYGITSLFTLWERVAEELDSHHHSAFSGLLDDIDALEATDPKQAINLLNSYLTKSQHKIILFIDNLVELFQNFNKKEEETLREVLITNNNIRLIGGSAISLEAFYDHQAPFYQFFNVITLKGLKKKDTIALLKKLSQHGGPEEEQKLNQLLKNDPGRIESIRRLTGGIPRTLVILFHILMDGPKGNTFKLLEETVDQTTPLYKHRMDDLSKQQKPIVNAIALNWDAMSAKEIAEVTRIGSKQVSAQLGQLEKQWIIEKIPTNTKNNLYALKERFFNIWYLMRYGRRRDKKKVIWLTRFFEIWCSSDELKQRSKSFIQQLDGSAHPKAALTFANALMCSDYLDTNDKVDLYRSTAEFLQQTGNERLQRELLDVELSADALIEQMSKFLEQWCVDRNSISEQQKEQTMAFLELNNLNVQLASVLLSEGDERSLVKAESILKQTDGKQSDLLLGSFYFDRNRYDDAEPILKRGLASQEVTISKDQQATTFKMLAEIYQSRDELAQAESNYLKAIERGAQNCNIILSQLYFAMHNYELCDQYAKYAIEANEKFAYRALGLSLFHQKKYQEALAPLLQSFELDGDVYSIYYWIGCAYAALGDVKQAENYLRKSLAIDTDNPDTLYLLTQILAGQKKTADAKIHFKKLLPSATTEQIGHIISLIIDTDDIEMAQQMLAKTEQADHLGIFNYVAWHCFKKHAHKEQALQWSTKAQTLQPKMESLHTHTTIQLWNNQYDAATTSMNLFLTEHMTELEENEADFIDLFTLFLAKGQTNLVEGWLKQYQLIDRLKPLYYALMSLMRDKYPNEILRMGAELKETVDEILQRIEQLAEDYK
ncbi:MAG: tetratricopeptide (TPR) repeat protein [Phenylobacterium sp.]|jgi:tetratricopeptide (TPR) repeat protein